MHAVAQQSVSCTIAEDRPAGVVAVQNREGRFLDEERLRVPVGLEGAVEFEVLVRQVGEHRRAVPAVPHAAQRQPMG